MTEEARCYDLLRTVLVSVLLFLGAVSHTQASSGDEMLKLGDGAYFGQGEPQSYSLALKHYRLAAEAGSVTAAHYVGFMLTQGLGTNVDYAEATLWLRKSADKGHGPAQYMLGQHYHLGRGVKQSYQQAFKWYEAAAKKGFTLAKRELSLMFARGEGVGVNVAWAAYYAAQASAEGDSIATQIIEQLLPHLPDFETNSDYTTLYEMPSFGAAKSAQVYEGSRLFQLDKIKADWVVVYSPEARRVAYLNINDLIPQQATAAGQ